MVLDRSLPASAPTDPPQLAPPPPARPPAGLDPVAAERLARLAERNAARNGAGVASPGARSTADPIRTRRAPRKRRHPAKGSRVAALVMSLATTGGLSAVFARADAATGVADAGDAAGVTAGATPAGATTAGTTATTAVDPATTIPTYQAPASDSTTSTGAATTAATTGETTPTTVLPTESGSGLADGAYTGAGDSNKWGTVQVAITVSGGQITDVSTLQYPDGERKSVQINQRALPTLRSEALSAQTAPIDTVSGATYTSESYAISLQSAIDQAIAA